MQRTWYITKNRVKVNWGSAVVAGKAAVAIYRLEDVEGSSNDVVRVWRAAGTPVSAKEIAAAQAAQSSDAVPSAPAKGPASGLVTDDRVAEQVKNGAKTKAALQAAVPGASDDAVSELVKTGAKTRASLSAAYVQTGATSGAFAAVIDGLRSDQSAAIQVAGDSTGNADDEWPYLLCQWLGQQVPAAHVRRRVWNDANQAYDPWAVIQTGAAGERHALFPGNQRTMTTAVASIPHPAGDLDIRVRASLDDWSPAATQSLFGHFGAAGQRGWVLQVTATGALSFQWTTDGTTVIQKTSSALPLADGAEAWVRVVLDVDNGQGGYTWLAYHSTDGITWTQIGSSVTTTGGATSVFAAPSTDYEIGGRGSNGEPVKGKIYEVQLRDGIDGKIVNPQPIDSWVPRALSGSNPAATFGGSPTLYLLNGSQSGSAVAYHAEATRLPKMCHPYSGSLVFLSLLHNSGADVGPVLLAQWDAYLAALKARLPSSSFCLLTQNPQVPPRTVDTIRPQAQRRRELMAWAARNAVACIDTYRAFADRPDGGVGLIAADGIHPTASTGSGTAGEDVWVQAVQRAFAARA